MMTNAEPRWWTPSDDAAWQLTRAVLRREWLAWYAESDLDDDPHEPDNDNLRIDWPLAERAALLGYRAALAPEADAEWSAELEYALERGWRCAGWNHLRGLVRRGWEHGRQDAGGPRAVPMRAHHGI